MEKSPDAFRTISEVAEWLDTPAHVLRFWESKFAQVKPIKRAGGRRYYRPSDMALLGGLKKLLHEDGLSIKGAQALIREQGVRHVAAMSPPLDDLEAAEAELEVVEAAAASAPVQEPKRAITGLPPLMLRETFEEEAEEEESEEPAVDDGGQPELPFLHRPYGERMPQARPDRAPLLRSAPRALDARGAPAVAEEVPLPEPEPLAVPRLDLLRAAIRAEAPSPATRSRITARLEALRQAIADDRTA